ncbi:2-oxoglutarate-dependent dioxygenase DAO, partial [Mucuna pruriens]
MVQEAIVPVVDYQKLMTEKEECERLREACEKSGCFRVVNHPIPLTLMKDMKAVVKYLHDLPMEIKVRNRSVIPDSGYVPSSEGVTPLYEGLGIYDMKSHQNAVEDFCNALKASPQQRKIIEEYSQAIYDLESSISQKMAESLGINDTDFKDWPFIFRVIKYNFTQETLGNIGILLHSDPEFITLLQDDETVGGLELKDGSNTFKAIPTQPGSFLCIVGDVGHVWSNGRFFNMKHRVLCKEVATRYSIGAFMLSPRSGIVEPHEKLVDANHKRLFSPLKYEDLRQFRITTGKRAGEFLEQYRIA